jgi:hypothetical protein
VMRDASPHQTRHVLLLQSPQERFAGRVWSGTAYPVRGRDLIQERGPLTGARMAPAPFARRKNASDQNGTVPGGNPPELIVRRKNASP